MRFSYCALGGIESLIELQEKSLGYQANLINYVAAEVKSGVRIRLRYVRKGKRTAVKINRSIQNLKDIRKVFLSWNEGLKAEKRVSTF